MWYYYFGTPRSVDLLAISNIYFIDGHSSHTAVEVADLCLDLGIILLALYPNTTRITQPADVAIFKPLKSAWKAAVCDWRINYGGDILSLKIFPSLLQKAIDSGIKKSSIVNGFRVCGLYPFGPENVDFSKCLASSSKSPSDTADLDQITMDTNDPLSVPDEECIASRNKVLISIDSIKEAFDDIGEERLHRIKTQPDLTEEEKIIRSLYEKLLAPHVAERGHDDLSISDDTVMCTDDKMTFANEGNTDSNCGILCKDVRDTETMDTMTDCSNAMRDGKADDIASFLQTPETPIRSKHHRNYTRKFFPILTAEERLNEIRCLEQAKEDAIKKKNEKTEQKKKNKKHADDMKLQKAAERETVKKHKEELREQKHLEILQRKKERELNRLFKHLKADGMRRDKLELLQALKLSKR
ncbi:uncharacterized protein LOC129779303 [Toxorhynchites rutilus septentrionalis]|uniref:uncharacterized protein LOC129779303 n=1 Tax=Toxorhynchites rutilus septentrionalis TaxID=329112 RepID=UPI002479C8E9|nr:uncharacterized protein LOC129779303 [Toxorhynchites rutilus septentrionalis]